MNKKDLIAPAALACIALTSATHPKAPTGNPVVHFEIGCRDLARTKDFYTNTFGWSATNMGVSEDLQTNSALGIQGHLVALGHEPFDYVTIYIQVEDIKTSLSRIEAAGGKHVVGPIPLPDKRQFAWFRDPEGNMVGLLQLP